MGWIDGLFRAYFEASKVNLVDVRNGLVVGWFVISIPFIGTVANAYACQNAERKQKKKCEYIFFAVPWHRMKWNLLFVCLKWHLNKSKKKKKCGKMVPLRAYKKFIPDSDVSIKACSMFTHAQTRARTQHKVDSNNRLSITKEIKEECAVPFGESEWFHWRCFGSQIYLLCFFSYLME